jgi:hypothetical protein
MASPGKGEKLFQVVSLNRQRVVNLGRHPLINSGGRGWSGWDGAQWKIH